MDTLQSCTNLVKTSHMSSHSTHAHFLVGLYCWSSERIKSKDTLLLNNIITQNPILVRRAWFWHVASHIRDLVQFINAPIIMHAT